MLERERQEVAAAARRLAAERLVVGTAGNVSSRRDEHLAVTPTGAPLADLTAEQVSVVGLDGGLAWGQLEPTSELALHLDIYRRLDAGAVVHTHAPIATALSSVLDEVPCVHYSMLSFGGSVRVAPYATFGTPELAESVLGALEGRTAALLANHGTVTCADDAAAAVEASLLLEWACEVYWRAAAIGSPRALGAPAQRAVVEAALSRGYGRTRPAAERSREES